MKFALCLAASLIVVTGCCPKVYYAASGTCSAASPAQNDCPPCLAPWVQENLGAGGVDPLAIRCNSQVHFGQNILRDARIASSRVVARYKKFLVANKAEDQDFKEDLADSIRWWMVRSVLLEGDNNNFGVMVLKDHFWTNPDGFQQPVLVFRLGYTPDPQEPGSCFRSVLMAGNVKHVVNLYDGNMPTSDLDKAEEAVATELGASYIRIADLDYGKWRHALEDHMDDGAERDEAFKALGRLIKEQLLLPNGQPPKGNILIHCGGGMHRSGMVSGILQRYINGDSMENVTTVYKFHVGYIDVNHPGGFEDNNLEVIEHFNPDYLK